MKIFDFSKTNHEVKEIPKELPEEGLFVVCRTNQFNKLQKHFNWDKSTANECVNLDETIRYNSFDSYDFISLIYIDIEDKNIIQSEINLFFSHKYLVLIIPEKPGPRLMALEQAVCEMVSSLANKPEKLVRLYYFIFSRLVADYSDVLEILEDELETLSHEITQNPCEKQIDEISKLRKSAYTSKKILRSLSYIGEEVVIDENALLKKNQLHYFRSIDTRLKKLYDFAASLYELSGVILSIYDSKLNIKMNETVNKLTFITLFFAPLTVITGIYGMNFKYMPELSWLNGYPFSIGLMIVVSLIIYIVMKRKKLL